MFGENNLQERKQFSRLKDARIQGKEIPN